MNKPAVFASEAEQAYTSAFLATCEQAGLDKEALLKRARCGRSHSGAATKMKKPSPRKEKGKSKKPKYKAKEAEQAYIAAFLDTCEQAGLDKDATVSALPALYRPAYDKPLDFFRSSPPPFNTSPLAKGVGGAGRSLRFGKGALLSLLALITGAGGYALGRHGSVPSDPNVPMNPNHPDWRRMSL